MSMTHTFDILRIEADGPLLLETATNLESAKARVCELNKTNPRRYEIFNQLTQMIILIDPESGPAN
jgi:hypothetical protein